MKGLQLDNGTIKTFNLIPKSWGKIIGGFNTLNDTELEAYGFYNIVNPTTTESQELGAIEWDADNSDSINSKGTKAQVVDYSLPNLM